MSDLGIFFFSNIRGEGLCLASRCWDVAGDPRGKLEYMLINTAHQEQGLLNGSPAICSTACSTFRFCITPHARGSWAVS